MKVSAPFGTARSEGRSRCCELAVNGVIALGAWPACVAAGSRCGQGAILVPFIILTAVIAACLASMVLWLVRRRLPSGPAA